jgi:ubiquinone/menaquinone biosynthesis C-methylase UbiE
MTRATIFDQLSSLADPTRGRLLLLLDRNELTVGELCAVLQLPQSTVSRHLKTLGDEGWVTSRAEGTSRQYRMTSPLDASSRRLWQLVRDQTVKTPLARNDTDRLRATLAERKLKSQEFFSGAASQWDAMRAELFGKRADVGSLLGLLDDTWTVGDLGCGTGPLSEALAPFVRRVVAVDSSRAMLAAARKRLDGLPNAELRQGELEALPVKDGELDAALLFLVLHYTVDPARVLAEAARALKPSGRLLIVDMTPHDHDEYRQQMGHLWQGFDAAQLKGWLHAAGFHGARYTPLSPDPAAKGPSLFAATGRTAAVSGKRQAGSDDGTTHRSKRSRSQLSA